MLDKEHTTNSNYVGIIILVCLVSFTLVLGVYGFSAIYQTKDEGSFTLITKWFDVLYETLKLFSLSSSPDDDVTKHWAISIARFTAACSVFFSIAFAAVLAAGNWFKANVMARFYHEHCIICGLNEQSSFLIDDLLRRKHHVIVIEDDHTNPLIAEYKQTAATLILGDANKIDVLLKASLLKAKQLVTMTNCDLNNLDILKTVVESEYSPQLECYIGIDNVMSYKLFEPGAFYSIENIKRQSSGLLINMFNLNELVAIELVQSMHLGKKIDTVSENAKPVQILIIGFDQIGEAILRELLLLSHFANQVKVEITIMSDEPTDFFESHHQVHANANGNGLDLWDIHFVSSSHNPENPSDFNHIIACNKNENHALKDILRIYDLCTVKQLREIDSTTSFHYYNKLDHDIQHQQIRSFGAIRKNASFDQLIDSSKEALAKRSHEMYAKTKLGLESEDPRAIVMALEKHDQQESNPNAWLNWVNQPLFKRRSNFTEKRHIPMKLLAFGGEMPNKIITELNEEFENDSSCDFLPFFKEFDDLDKQLIGNWIRYIKQELKLDEAEITSRFHGLARAEHNRWNAFHVVNNWRYGEQKNEALKTHDCLLNWKDLEEKRADTIKYDYKNVYHIPESLALAYSMNNQK